MLLAATVLGAGVLLAPAVGGADEVTHALARKHFDTGKTYYQVANHKRALEEFEKAYELQPLPELRYNIGRCHEALGQLEKAIEDYRGYLRGKPDAADRAVLEARIANLERRLAESKPRPEPERTAPAPAEAPSRWKRTAGWTATAVGVAALAGGVALGALVRSKSNDYRDGAAAGKTYFELEQIADSGRSYQRGELTLLIVGGVVAASGIGLLIWDATSRPEERAAGSLSARLLPCAGGRGGVGLCTSGRF